MGLAGGLRHLNDVTEWGIPWLRAKQGEQGGGRLACLRQA